MKIKHILSLAVVSVIALSACKQWTQPEPINKTDVNSYPVKEKDMSHYYNSLKTYKASDHEVMMGWFGGWNGSGQGALTSIPDSVDFVSIWGNWDKPTPLMLQDLKEVQTKKGTKAVIACLIFEVGDKLTPSIPKEKEEAYKAEGLDKNQMWTKWRREYWKFTEDDYRNDTEAFKSAVTTYANALCDTIIKLGYDGLDLDAEPGYRQPFPVIGELWNGMGASAGGRTISDPSLQLPTMKLFMETVIKRLKTDLPEGEKKLIVVDGEPDAMPRELAKDIDYYIFQAYNDNPTPRAGRLEKLVDNLKKEGEHGREVADLIKRSIFTVDFETNQAVGGSYINGNSSTETGELISKSSPERLLIGQLLNFALWQPTYQGQTYRKGGVGTYHFENDFSKLSDKRLKRVAGIGWDTSMAHGSYPWTRMAISIMNPTIK